MRIGDEAKVKLVAKQKKNIYLVLNIDTAEEGILTVNGNLKVKDEIASVWVIGFDKSKNMYLYGNAYFGKYNISSNISNKYVSIISMLYRNDSKIADSDISELKGMVNRCIRKDQWDWYTTYEYLGYPNRVLMKEFVQDSVLLRDEIRNNNREHLKTYKDKYYYIFNSMLYHLNSKLDDNIHDLDIPTKEFDKSLWIKLLPESQKNIKILDNLDNNASIYVLMHYFVTLEQEFINHLIKPFIDLNKNKYKTTKLNNEDLQKTFEILTGQGHFSLGSIYYIGRDVSNLASRKKCKVINDYAKFLGDDINKFVNICNIIRKAKIGSLYIVNMRNGLAHGEQEIISRISKNAYYELKKFLLGHPDSVIIKILEISKK